MQNREDVFLEHKIYNHCSRLLLLTTLFKRNINKNKSLFHDPSYIKFYALSENLFI